MKKTKSSVKKNAIPIEPGLRIPRPFGATGLLLQMSKNPDQSNKEKVQNLVINQYVANGFSICGKTLTLEQFAMYIELPMDILNTKLFKISSQFSNFQDPEHLSNVVSTLLSLTTNWSLKTQGEIMNQVEVLKRSQGNTYVPFISSSLNQILDISVKSQKSLMELFNTFSQTKSNNTVQELISFIFNNANQNQNKGEKELPITKKEALELLYDQKSLTPKVENSSMQIPEAVVDKMEDNTRHLIETNQLSKNHLDVIAANFDEEHPLSLSVIPNKPNKAIEE